MEDGKISTFHFFLDFFVSFVSSWFIFIGIWQDVGDFGHLSCVGELECLWQGSFRDGECRVGVVAVGDEAIGSGGRLSGDSGFS